jgi:hypothetical protein
MLKSDLLLDSLTPDILNWLKLPQLDSEAETDFHPTFLIIEASASLILSVVHTIRKECGSAC